MCIHLLVIYQQILIIIDQIHELFNGVMVGNTWHLDTKSKTIYGTFNYRGYRPEGCGVGVPSGAHYKGMALDFDVWYGSRKLDTELVRKKIIENKDIFKGNLKGLEVAEWVHVDVMERVVQKPGQVCVFNPAGFVRWA